MSEVNEMPLEVGSAIRHAALLTAIEALELAQNSVHLPTERRIEADDRRAELAKEVVRMLALVDPQ